MRKSNLHLVLKEVDKETKKSLFGELSAEILKKGFFLRLRARGLSMLPFFRDGDIILVESSRRDSLKKGGCDKRIKFGDVVFYISSDQKIVIHRVIERRDAGNKGTVLVTKGDFLFGPDRPIRLEKVLGKVIAIERIGHKVRLDRGFNRALNVFVALISPFSSWIERVASFFGLKVYRG